MKIELDGIHTRPCLEYTPDPLSTLPALNTWSEETLPVFLFGEGGDVWRRFAFAVFVLGLQEDRFSFPSHYVAPVLLFIIFSWRVW